MDEERAAHGQDELRVLREALDTVQALVIVLDPEGRIVKFNRACEQLSGRSSSEVKGRDFFELFIPPEDLTGVRGAFLQLESRDLPNSHENDWLTRDGHRARIAWTNTAIADGSELRYIVGTGIDVTDSRRVATRHRMREAEMLSLVETAHEGIWTIDLEGKTTFANQRMAEMLGCTLEELESRSMWDFMDDEGRHQAERNMGRRVAGQSEQHDFLFRRLDGSEFWCIIATNPTHDESGAVDGALGMVTDITDRKRAEESTARLLDELDHRVKNTMAGVIALVDETLESTPTIEELSGKLMGRLQALAASHEALSRFGWRAVGFGELVRGVLGPFLAAYPGRLECQGPELTLDARIVSPTGSILHELVTNAVKHGALASPGGHIDLSWEHTAAGHHRIRWIESGLSIAEPSGRSTGIGLGLIEDLVQLGLGGEIEMDFRPAGLQATIELPPLAAAAQPG